MCGKTELLIEQLHKKADLPDDALKELIESNECQQQLFRKADDVRREYYGISVYIRGLIEFTNYCKNNCYYCGIRLDNVGLYRYRLSAEEILTCCDTGHKLGFRTFVLQGGEDPHYEDETMCGIVSAIKSKYPDCAVTLSLGEKTYESYKAFFDAGADRYLLRHETADEAHYQQLHPKSMSIETRKKCLRTLKAIGYQVGSGFMVGSPYQTTENLVQDIRFLQKLKPAMIGIGPYIPHKDTPFGHSAPVTHGSLDLTLRLIAILRLMFPHVLIPATTALGTIAPYGRELGLQAGANVVMPNLSPIAVRKQYALYDGKIYLGDEAAEGRESLETRIKHAGYQIVSARGDAKEYT